MVVIGHCKPIHWKLHIRTHIANPCGPLVWNHAQLYISMIHCKLRVDVRASGHLEMLVVTVADRDQC